VLLTVRPAYLKFVPIGDELCVAGRRGHGAQDINDNAEALRLSGVHPQTIRDTGLPFRRAVTLGVYGCLPHKGHQTASKARLQASTPSRPNYPDHPPDYQHLNGCDFCLLVEWWTYTADGSAEGAASSVRASADSRCLSDAAR
jgi:hypothetical protein